MEASKSTKEKLLEGLRLERSGELEAAAAQYRKITDSDPINPEAVGRLLVLYRKQKNFREELAVINRALAGYAERDKARQAQWVRTHSKAAAAGKAVFRKLGGASVSGFGADPAVTTLIRRKENLERKISGKKATRQIRKSERQPATEMRKVQSKVRSEQKKQESQRKLEFLEQRKQEKRKQRETAAAQRRLKSAMEKERKAQQKAAKEAAAKAAQEKKQPSIFVITLTYKAPLAEVDAAMDSHIAYLNKHFRRGNIVASGRQVPPTGEIILAKGKDHSGVERMMKGDPLVKRGLALAQVVEFKASKAGNGILRHLSLPDNLK